MPSRNLISETQGIFPGHGSPADLEELARKRITLEAGEALIRSGEKYKCMFIVDDGWLLRARHSPGGTRQIVNFALPGDLLQHDDVRTLEFDIVARTSASLWELETKSFRADDGAPSGAGRGADVVERA